MHENDNFFIINKPAGLVVHEGAGTQGTELLTDILCQQYPSLVNLKRAGLVHRLDKDTTGLMLIAKNEVYLEKLQELLRLREIKREYQAFISGYPRVKFTIDNFIERHPSHRQKKICRSLGSRRSITHVRLLSQYGAYAHILCNLETGRTHQIRVQLSNASLPIIGDSLYGGMQLPDVTRTMLHAYQITIPGYGMWTVPLPEDMKACLQFLKLTSIQEKL